LRKLVVNGVGIRTNEDVIADVRPPCQLAEIPGDLKSIAVSNSWRREGGSVAVRRLAGIDQSPSIGPGREILAGSKALLSDNQMALVKPTS